MIDARLRPRSRELTVRDPATLPAGELGNRLVDDEPHDLFGLADAFVHLVSTPPTLAP